MEGQRVAKKTGGGKLPWVITGLVAGTALAGYLGLCAWVGGQQTIFPNVSVLGIDLSGMTAEQAGSTLAQTMAQEGGQVKVTLRYQDWSGELTAGELEQDWEDLAQLAAQKGRGNFLTQGAVYLSCLVGGENLTLDREESGQPALERLLDQADREAGGSVTTASYVVGETQLHMTKGVTGVAMDRERARTEVLDALEEGLWKKFGQGAEGTVDQVVTLSAIQTSPQEPDFDAVHQEVFREPKDAEMDPETFEVTDHTVGVDFDVSVLKAAYASAKEGETISCPLILTQPEETREGLEGKLFRDLLGEATTTVTGNSARKSNVKIAADRCSNVILLPGEEFSYNNTAGPFSASVGYLPAPVYVAGRSEDGIGGGVCQPSSTLYYAVLHTTLEIVERRNHQFAVSYMPAGMDATVTGSSIDFRFKNNTAYPIKIVTSSYDSGGSRKLNVKIYGTNVDGRYGVPSNVVYDVVEPTTTYQPDAGVPRGTLVLEREQNPYTGKKARTYRTICEADGTVVEKQNLGVSSYKMRTRIYYYNPADGDPNTWVNGKPPAAVTEPTPPTDPGTTTPADPGTTTPADPGTTVDPGAATDPGAAVPADPGTAEPDPSPEPSDSGLNPINPDSMVG